MTERGLEAGSRVRPREARLALSPAEAAESLGVSVDHFQRHVQPAIRVVYVGRRRLIPVRELEAWLDAAACRPVGGSV